MEIEPQFQVSLSTSARIEPSRGLNTTIRPLQPLSRLASEGEQPDSTPTIKLRAGWGTPADVESSSRTLTMGSC